LVERRHVICAAHSLQFGSGEFCCEDQGVGSKQFSHPLRRSRLDELGPAELDFSENLVDAFPLHKREVANTAQLNAQRFSNKRADPVERFLGT